MGLRPARISAMMVRRRFLVVLDISSLLEMDYALERERFRTTERPAVSGKLGHNPAFVVRHA
jgi:hypothetical protein